MEQNMLVVPMHVPLTGDYCGTVRIRRRTGYADVEIRPQPVPGNAPEYFLLTNNGIRAVHPRAHTAVLRDSDIIYGAAAMNEEGICVCCGAVHGYEQEFSEAMVRLRLCFSTVSGEELLRAQLAAEGLGQYPSLADLLYPAGLPASASEEGGSIPVAARGGPAAPAPQPEPDGTVVAPSTRYRAVLGREPGQPHNAIPPEKAEDGAIYVSAGMPPGAAPISGQEPPGGPPEAPVAPPPEEASVTCPFALPGDELEDCPFHLHVNPSMERFSANADEIMHELSELHGETRLSAKQAAHPALSPAPPAPSTPAKREEASIPAVNPRRPVGPPGQGERPANPATPPGQSSGQSPGQPRPPAPLPPRPPQPAPKPPPQPKPPLQWAPGPGHATRPQPCESPFPHHFPGASWTCATRANGTKIYEGRMRRGGGVVVITAVPGAYSPLPPKNLPGFSRYVQTKNGGFWLRIRMENS